MLEKFKSKKILFFMQKKGQIAIWVIVALVIVVLGIAAYLIFPDFFRIGFNKQKAKQIILEQSENLRDTIAYCTEETVKYCLDKIGRRGGYYNVDSLKKFDFAGDKYVVVYCDNGQYINKLPSLNYIFDVSLQQCFENEGNNMIDNCVKLNNFKRFFSIKELERRKINVNAYSDCDVYVNISWPMLLSKTTLAGKVEQKIDQKEIVFPMCVKKLWDIASDIVTLEVEKGIWYNNADKYIQDHSYEKLRYVDIKTQVPSGEWQATIFMLKSIPFRPKEKEFSLYFVISRKDEVGEERERRDCIRF
jgi:hypothetical protein